MRIVKIITLIGIVAIVLLLPIETFAIFDPLNLCTGFILFSAGVVYRESSVLNSIIWTLLALTLGLFVTASLYTIIALQTSQGDWRQFWMGKRAV